MKCVSEAFVPGRLCILGEHTDWIGGYRAVNRRIATGLTLVCTTSEGLHARYSTYKKGLIRYAHCKPSLNPAHKEGSGVDDASSDTQKKITDEEGEVEEFITDFDLHKLKETAKAGGFFSYVAGTLAACIERHMAENPGDGCAALHEHGLEIVNYRSTLPMKKGLSSSASVCVLVATCFNELFNDPGSWVLRRGGVEDGGGAVATFTEPTATATATAQGAGEIETLVGEIDAVVGGAAPKADAALAQNRTPACAPHKWSRVVLMDVAYRGERYTPSRCGRMDQCVAMGKGRIGLMQFSAVGSDPSGTGCGPNSDSVSGSSSANSPHQVQPVLPPASLPPDIRTIYNHQPLHFVVGDVMGSKNTVAILGALNACFPFPADSKQSRMHRYAAHCHKHVWGSVACIERGMGAGLGACMDDAQGLFDNCAIELCPSELRSPKLHGLLHNTSLRKLSWGMKGIGSQGDGSIQILCRGAAEQIEVMRIMQDELGCHCFPLTIPATSSEAASEGEPVKLTVPGQESIVSPQDQVPLLKQSQSPTNHKGKIPPSLPLLLHPNHIRCALVVADGNMLHRYTGAAGGSAAVGGAGNGYGSFAYLGNNAIVPCLLPLPFPDGTTTCLMSILSELILTHGIQRIAVVVTAPATQWDDAAYESLLQEEEDEGEAVEIDDAGDQMDAIDTRPVKPKPPPKGGNTGGSTGMPAPAPMLGGGKGAGMRGASTGAAVGKSFSTTEAFAPSKEASNSAAQFSAAFAPLHQFRARDGNIVAAVEAANGSGFNSALLSPVGSPTKRGSGGMRSPVRSLRKSAGGGENGSQQQGKPSSKSGMSVDDDDFGFYDDGWAHDTVWLPAEEEFDYIKARCRFFFDDPKHAWSPYATMIQALEMLERSAEKLVEEGVVEVNAGGRSGNGSSGGAAASTSSSVSAVSSLPVAASVGSPPPHPHSQSQPQPHNSSNSNAHHSPSSETSSSMGGLVKSISSFGAGLTRLMSSGNMGAAASNSSGASTSPRPDAVGTKPNPARSAAPAAPAAAANQSKYQFAQGKRYVGPLLVCRAESLPLPPMPGDHRDSGRDSGPQGGYLGDMVAAMAEAWHSNVSVQPATTLPTPGAESKALAAAAPASILCRPGLPVIGVEAAESVAASTGAPSKAHLAGSVAGGRRGSWQLRATRGPGGVLQCGDTGAFPVEFSGQALVPFRSLVTFLKKSEEAYEDDILSGRPDWMREDMHPVDAIIRGLVSSAGGGTAGNSNASVMQQQQQQSQQPGQPAFRPCQPVLIDSRRLHHVMTESDYKCALRRELLQST